jgi:serine/threonine protein kinase
VTCDGDGDGDGDVYCGDYRLHFPDVAPLLRFVQRGSLWDMLRRAQADPSQLPWSRRLKFAAEVHCHAVTKSLWRVWDVTPLAQAAAGMMYLHSRKPPIVHRDVKSDNFLITADWNLKVTLPLPLPLPLLNTRRSVTLVSLACAQLHHMCKRCVVGMLVGCAWRRRCRDVCLAQVHGRAGTPAWMAPEVSALPV